MFYVIRGNFQTHTPWDGISNENDTASTRLCLSPSSSLNPSPPANIRSLIMPERALNAMKQKISWKPSEGETSQRNKI